MISKGFFSELLPQGECSLPLRLRRSLSVIYYWNGNETNIDPRCCTDATERRGREDAILQQHPDTGYAEGIREARAENSTVSTFSCDII